MSGRKQGGNGAAADEAPQAIAAFDGYGPPTSSTTYTPNQLFDVVLPNASRGCLRLVAYLIQKTLRISDKDGNPMYPEAHASYRELSEKAGIGRGRVKEAIDEAIERRYVDCLRFGKPHRAGEEGYSALYSLRWDERPEYVTDPERFEGFFAGEGNYTRIPNDFFDHTIPNENLSVVRVVGVVIRHTIGWQQKVGFRRQQVRMSFTEIMRRSGISSRSTVNTAIKDAIARNHIERVEEGLFDPYSGVATVWGVKWTDAPKVPVVEPARGMGPGIETRIQPQNRTRPGETAPKPNQGISPGNEPDLRTRNQTSLSTSAPESNQPERTEIEPGDGPHFESGSAPKPNRQAIRNRTSKETNLNSSSKRQANEEPVVAGSDPLALLVEELVRVGVTPQKAKLLVAEEPAEVIRRQLDWLPRRVVKKTAAGLLIACIEQDLPEPAASAPQSSEETSPARLYAEGFYEGLTGAQGTTLAEPTASDERRAQGLLQRLRLEAPTQMAPAGRVFGTYVRAKEAGKSNPVRMLSLAVTLYADEFLAQECARGKAAVKRSAEDARKAHEERFSGDYHAFVASLAERLESNDALLDAFDAHVAKKLAERKKISPRATEILENQLRDETERARLLVEFAQERGALKVPSFWDWDRTRNDRSFEAAH